MPCNMLATVRAKVAVNVERELKAQTPERLAAALTALLGSQVQVSRGWYGTYIYIGIEPKGGALARTGFLLQDGVLSGQRSESETAVNAMKAILERVAGMSVQARVALALAGLGTVTSQETGAGGALAMKLNI